MIPGPARFWPLESGRIITSPFGQRSDGFHTGCDFGWPGGSAGKPVYAVQAGTVIFAGTAQGYGGPDPAGWLVIDSSTEQGGGCLEYGHIVREVGVGARVAAGQRIGHINPDSGTNGGVAPHLHLSDMPRAYAPNTKQDPLPRLAGAREPGQENTVAATAFDYGITKTVHGFNPRTGANCTGNSNGPRARTLYVVFHSQEGDGTAVSLANYCNSTWDKGPKAVSYNLTIDDNDTVENVPVSEGSWSAVDANNIAVHICIAGSRAEWTRDQWMKRVKSLDRAAKAAAAACRQYDIPAVKVLATDGWPVTPKGLAAHADFGKRGGGHTDPGANFPFPYVINKVIELLGTPTTPEAPVDKPDPLTDIHRQLLGRWEMLGWRTPIEALAVLVDAATGSTNAGKTGWKPV